MPSTILGQPYASGAQQIISGNPWSGTWFPVGGIQFLWVSSGGNAYIGVSGGNPVLSGSFLTINSGGMMLSGGPASGFLDGICIPPGTPYFIPKARFPISGIYNMYALCDAAASGIGRLYFEAF